MMRERNIIESADQLATPDRDDESAPAPPDVEPERGDIDDSGDLSDGPVE